MVFIVYSNKNLTSKNIAEAIIDSVGFDEAENLGGLKHLKYDNVSLLEINSDILKSDFIDDLAKTDFVVFVCSHTSSKGIASLTVHSEGNWSDSALLGGKPSSLSTAAPSYMFDIISNLFKNNWTGFPVIYEATHHGPFLNAPSMFVEIGGTAEALLNKDYAKIVAKSVMDALLDKSNKVQKTIVSGFGGMHYASKFTKMAMQKGYAFAHIMPKYYIDKTDMVTQAVGRSAMKVEKGIIEWKSINSDQRSKIIEKLNDIGIDYEKI